MFINHLTLSLVIVTGVLFLGARYVLMGEGREQDRAAYALAFGAGGVIMAVTGFATALTWPLPGQYNILFGEPLTYFGVLLLLGSVALGRGASLAPLAVLGQFGGAATILDAIAIGRYGLTLVPVVAAVAFAASGLAALAFPLRGRLAAVRIAVGALLCVAGALFAFIAAGSILHHLGPGAYDGWRPAPMRGGG